MNVLIVSNCATGVFVEALRQLEPSWDVRGVVATLAMTWVDPGTENAEFLNFARRCDLFVSWVPESTFAPYVCERAIRVTIPRFRFSGLHPDKFKLADAESIFGKSHHSRIVVDSFRAGLSVDRTVERFEEATYEAYDFFKAFDRERRGLIETYATHGIDLSESIERWLRSGTFVYTSIHPRANVLVEILCRALASAGLLAGSPVDAAARVAVHDYFAESNIWPVYPEIASARGIRGSLTWRLDSEKKHATFDLPQFVAGSFAKLELTARASELRVPDR